MPLTDELETRLDRLASFDGGPFPVVSLYLNLQPDRHGRDHFEPFLRKELAERVRTYPGGTVERESLDHDAQKVRRYLEEIDPAANGVALFACSGAGLFDAITLAAPIDEHRLYIAAQPHLYPLARLLDAYPRYAVLLADTSSARIVVVAGNAVREAETIERPKTKRHKMGGWAQARYQRHVDNYHVHHAKEVVEALARIMRDEAIESLFISGDAVIVPLIKEHLPADVAARVVDVLRLDVRAPEREVLEATTAVMRERDADTDRERVDALLGAYRANGLAVVGLDPTRKALEMGQVDELVLVAAPAAIVAKSRPSGGAGRPAEELAGELVAKARQTGAHIRFIEDARLLASVGGVGAFLRFRF